MSTCIIKYLVINDYIDRPTALKPLKRAVENQQRNFHSTHGYNRRQVSSCVPYYRAFPRFRVSRNRRVIMYTTRGETCTDVYGSGLSHAIDISVCRLALNTPLHHIHALAPSLYPSMSPDAFLSQKCKD